MGALCSVCGAKMVLVGAARPEISKVLSHVDILQLNWPVAVLAVEIHATSNSFWNIDEKERLIIKDKAVDGAPCLHRIIRIQMHSPTSKYGQIIKKSTSNCSPTFY